MRGGEGRGNPAACLHLPCHTEVTENMYFFPLVRYICVYVPEIFYMLMALFMTEASALCIAIVEFWRIAHNTHVTILAVRMIHTHKKSSNSKNATTMRREWIGAEKKWAKQEAKKVKNNANRKLSASVKHKLVFEICRRFSFCALLVKL